MLEFYQVLDKDESWKNLSEEAKLAREMGNPPWKLSYVSGGELVQQWSLGLEQIGIVGLIFDPEFWYNEVCWNRWVSEILKHGTDGYINVPLGNQDLSWSQEIGRPFYVTLKGLENTESFFGKIKWKIHEAVKPECYCVSIIPVSILRSIPDYLQFRDLPLYLAEQNTQVRIFCEGWLHSFNALESAEYRTDLIELCEWEGKKVLELGCRSGLMGKHCKENFQAVYWFGIDIDEKALRTAKANLDLSIKANAEKALPLLQSKQFDRIVCADFLEHLAYPWHILTELHKYIKKNGLLIASFPNIGHWSIVQDLVNGRWDETPSGILCVSHLRFGTKRNWKNWFEKSGWNIVDWGNEILSLPPCWEKLVQSWEYTADRQSLETIRYRVVAQPTYN